MMLYFERGFRFRLLVLVCLMILPEIMLAGYTAFTKQGPEIWQVALCGMLSFIIAWAGAEFLILRRISGVIKLSKKAVKNAQEAQSRLNELEVIHEVCSVLRVATEMDEIMSILLDKAMLMVNAVMGNIWLYEPSTNTLNQILSKGGADVAPYARPGEGIVGTVFATGQPYFTLGLKDERFSSNFRGVYIPIRTTHAIVGVLMVGFQAAQELSEYQIRLLTIITEMAGNNIHRMKLHEQTRCQLQKLSALHQIDLAITSSLDIGSTLQVLLDQVITQLRVDAACVLIHNAHEQTLEFATSRGFTTDALRYTRLKFGEGFAGQAALEQHTVHIPDLNTCQSDLLHLPAFTTEGFVTYYAAPLIIRGQVKGVLEVFHRTSIERDHEWQDFLEALASQAAIAIENASLFTELQRSNIELNLAYDSTLEGWSRALDLHDRETENHSQRVTQTTLKLARSMSVDEAELVQIRRGALLHDIGKLGVPDSILLKPGPLTPEEMAVVRKHPTLAFEMLSPIAYLRPALDIPYCHHEKWDGSGYPRGLKGEQIPLAARIFAVVDVWDALISDRPYKKSWPKEKVHTYLQEHSGHHFDPRVVDAFLALLESDESVRTP